MKDYQLHTPQKELLLANRRTKTISQHTKKPQKISKKCLNSAFSSVSEDALIESPNESIDFSSISDGFDDNKIFESAESFIASLNPSVSPSSEKVAVSELALLSSTITAEKDGLGDASINHYGCAEFSGTKTGSIEADMVVKHLRQARIQTLNSVDADLQFKKLLDALIKVVIEELYGLPEEKDWFTELVSRKARVVFLSFVLWILAVAAVFFFNSGVQSSFSEPPPT